MSDDGERSSHGALCLPYFQVFRSSSFFWVFQVFSGSLHFPGSYSVSRSHNFFGSLCFSDSLLFSGSPMAFLVRFVPLALSVPLFLFVSFVFFAFLVLVMSLFVSSSLLISSFLWWSSFSTFSLVHLLSSCCSLFSPNVRSSVSTPSEAAPFQALFCAKARMRKSCGHTQNCGHKKEPKGVRWRHFL